MEKNLFVTGCIGFIAKDFIDIYYNLEGSKIKDPLKLIVFWKD